MPEDTPTNQVAIVLAFGVITWLAKTIYELVVQRQQRAEQGDDDPVKTMARVLEKLVRMEESTARVLKAVDERTHISARQLDNLERTHHGPGALDKEGLPKWWGRDTTKEAARAADESARAADEIRALRNDLAQLRHNGETA